MPKNKLRIYKKSLFLKMRFFLINYDRIINNRKYDQILFRQFRPYVHRRLTSMYVYHFPILFYSGFTNTSGNINQQYYFRNQSVNIIFGD